MTTHQLFTTQLAGDITAGAKLVSYTQRGDGPELTLLDVLEVEAPDRLEGAHFHPDDLITITVRSPHGSGHYAMVLKAVSPLVVAGIVP